MKYLLILKAHQDICGNEVGLITHQSQFLNITVKEEVIDEEQTMLYAFEKYKQQGIHFDYIYLCTHADGIAFEIEMGINKSDMTWVVLDKLFVKVVF